jgi:hypothetical protein
MAKHRPRTGEKRQVNQPLKIDRLPPEVRDTIQYLYNVAGKTWDEIEELSSLEYSEKWRDGKGGFVNWHDLPLSVLELFPEMRLPRTSLHRWFDLRIQQVSRSVMERSAQAREIAEAFAAATVKGADEAVINAARDQILSILTEDMTPKNRMSAAKALISLGEVMQGARANTIRERKVAVDERKLIQLEKDAELKRKRLEQETNDAAKKIEGGGRVTVDDINRIRAATFGLPPIKQPAA